MEDNMPDILSKKDTMKKTDKTFEKRVDGIIKKKKKKS